MSHVLARRLGVAALTGALISSGALLAAPAGASPALAAPTVAPPSGSVSVEAGADWLVSQLTDGLVYNPSFGGFNDIGLSIDVAFGLAAVGRTTDAQTVADAVAPEVDDYTGTEPSIYASSTAKAAAFAQAMGKNPETFGGVDLIERLEDRVASADPIAGRLEDKENPKFPGDYANVIGQSFAASSLTDAGSAKADSVTDFLLDQQCNAGYFRLYFTKDKTAADQTCQGGLASGDSAADTDATAIVIQQLQPLTASNRPVRAAVTKAAKWLKNTQKSDGSFGGGALTEASNSNSTGLAGAALGLVEEAGAAANAATWVRARQANEIAGCRLPLAKDNGAIAYDDAALKAARIEGITALTGDQWRRASAQALEALQYAPQGSKSASPTLAVCGRTEFVKARSKQVLTVVGVPTGKSVTVTGPRLNRTIVGTGTKVKLTVKLPKTAGKRVFTVKRGNTSARVVFRALSAKKLKVTLPTRVKKRGKKSKVVVRGLASGESVKVRYRGQVIGKGSAKKSGVYKTKFKVGRKKGTFKVKVRGEFANRKGIVRQRVK